MHKYQQVIYFDGPSGTQVIQSSIDAVIKYLVEGGANLGGKYPTSVETEEIMVKARRAMADFVGAKSEEIAFGVNTTTLAFTVSRGLSREWQKGDEIVVTELDHRANVDPWITAAEEKGVTVRWIKLDTEKLELKLGNLNQIINEKTKLVAVGHASNGVGTINNVEAIAAKTKEVGAIFVVDAVHSAPHILIDRDSICADILFCSAYKFFAPHVGIVIIKKELFEKMKSYKVISSPEYIPEILETGTQNFEGIAGITPAIDFIASLGKGNNRREKIISAFDIIKTYEDNLIEQLRGTLKNIPEVQILQAPENTPKTPTIAFRIEGISPAKACEYFSNTFGIFVGDGHFYAQTIGDILGINDTGGWIRAGIAPYSTEEEVERFIQAINSLINEIKKE